MMPVLSSVTAPTEMDWKWVGTPSPELAQRYGEFWAAQAQELSQSVQEPENGSYLYTTALWLVKKGYEAAGHVSTVFTKSTRVPMEHDRVVRAAQKLKTIGSCQYAALFVERIVRVYTEAKHSFSSSDRSGKLTSIISDPMKEPSEKVDAMFEFITLKSSTQGFEDLYDNNGTKLFQTIVCLTEKSEIVEQ